MYYTYTLYLYIFYTSPIWGSIFYILHVYSILYDMVGTLILHYALYYVQYDYIYIYIYICVTLYYGDTLYVYLDYIIISMYAHFMYTCHMCIR